MNLNDSFHQNNLEKIIQPNKYGYLQINQNNKLSSRNSLNNEVNKIIYLNNNIIKKYFSSKSFNQIDKSTNNTYIKNYKKIFNNKNNINLNKKRVNQIMPYEIKENEYIYNLAMTNLNKYKDNLVKEKDIFQISNQINNNKYTNNIINYCLINPINKKILRKIKIYTKIMNQIKITIIYII